MTVVGMYFYIRQTAVFSGLFNYFDNHFVFRSMGVMGAGANYKPNKFTLPQKRGKPLEYIGVRDVASAIFEEQAETFASRFFYKTFDMLIFKRLLQKLISPKRLLE